MTVRILLLLVCLLLLGGLIYYFMSTGLLEVPFLSKNLIAVPVTQAPTSSTSLVASSTPSNHQTPVSVLPTIPSNPPVTPTPTPPSTPVSSVTTITNADNNGTVDLSNGQEFAIDLGGGLNWTVQFMPAASVSQVSASTTGAPQGTFKAVAPGSVEVKGSGAPICGPHQACPQFLAVFSTTLQVQ
jgi:hypothetical protein